MSVLLVQGDARRLPLADGSVHVTVTSPPFWGLRDYGMAEQLGLEPVPFCSRGACEQCYVCHLVQVFRSVWRVLRDDGTCWINLGDSYAAGKQGRDDAGRNIGGRGGNMLGSGNPGHGKARPAPPGLKPKNLCGLPWRVALALQADGWTLRSAITLCKLNPMPESVADRPSSATEMMFLLTKSPHYFYDQEAVRVPHVSAGDSRNHTGYVPQRERNRGGRTDGYTTTTGACSWPAGGRNLRNWWPVVSEGFPGKHFATFGQKWIEPCILAGSSAHGCCPQCLAPYQRVATSWRIHRDELPPTDPRYRPRQYTGSYADNPARGTDRRDQGGGYRHTTTLGWEPSCACKAGSPIPCTTLDPFAGSGTTGVVAVKHGRRAVLVDLNRDYLALARQRLTNVQVNLLEGLR